MKRNSSIEILRIIAMFLIFGGHFYNQSDISLICSVGGGYITNLLTHGARISVNIFMFITCYFMADVNYKVKGSKVIGTYFMLWFYSATLGIAVLFINEQFSYAVIKSIFPFLGGSLWYMTMYISFLLLFPYISKITYLSKEKHKILSIICIIIFCIYSSIHRFVEGMLAYYGWIVVCYICFSFYRRYLEEKIKTRYIVVAAITGIIGYMALVYVISYVNSEAIVSYASYYLVEMTTFPNAFIALAIVLLATRIDIGNIRCINKISGCMGAVYIAHQVEAFYPILWRLICNISKNFLANVSIQNVLLITFLGFSTVVFFVENVRIFIFKKFHNISIFKVIENTYDILN